MLTTPSPEVWIVAGSGPSLSAKVADRCRGFNCIAVNDAYKLFPFARILYAADEEWWKLHKGAPDFAGERWSTIGADVQNKVAKQYRIKLIPSPKRAEGFSFVPGVIHRGSNSGFQATNLALLLGARRVVLVGFDMKGSHFFGEHPPMPRRSPSARPPAIWLRKFERAAELLPAGVEIINATPDSALQCFPMMTLEEALSDAKHRHA